MEVPSPQIFKDNSTIKIQHSKIRLAKAIINAFRVFVKTMMEKEIEEPIPEPVDHKKIAIDIKSQM